MHKDYMQMALELAAKALGRTNPNPMVGAVIVKDEQIIGRGYHQKAGTPHAEVHALNEAGLLARDATMYVTLEPCSHYGRTPPCAYAIAQSGIKEVFVAMIDPNPQVAGRGIKILRDAGIKVSIGLLGEEAQKLNEVFIKYITTGEPFVVLKSAVSLDGKIATRTGHAKWITGDKAREKSHQLRNTYDAILVGIGTVLADNPALNTRLAGEMGRDPVRIILDSRARISPEAQVITQKSTAPTIIVTSDQAPSDKIGALRASGIEVWNLPEKNGMINLKALMNELVSHEITSLLVEGGAQVNASFLEKGLVDKVCWFIAPKFIGGHEAPGAIAGSGIQNMNQALLVKDIEITRLGEDILIEGYINKSPLI